MTWIQKIICLQVSPCSFAPSRLIEAVVPSLNFWWTLAALGDIWSHETLQEALVKRHPICKPCAKTQPEVTVKNIQPHLSSLVRDQSLLRWDRNNDNSSPDYCFSLSWSFSWLLGHTCSAPWTMSVDHSVMSREMARYSKAVFWETSLRIVAFDKKNQVLKRNQTCDPSLPKWCFLFSTFLLTFTHL